MRITALASLALAACGGDLPPWGEVAVTIDTDLPVPRLAGRVRVDVYDETGRWFQSRDIARRDARDWPMSFGMVLRDDERHGLALLRVRAYPEGMERDYLGERFEPRPQFVEPFVPKEVYDLCNAPPSLPLGTVVRVRRGRNPFTGLDHGGPSCANQKTATGAAGARVEIVAPGSYWFGVVDVNPPYKYGQLVSLQLRRECESSASAIACEAADQPPSFEVELQPGSYFLVAGGFNTAREPTDIVLGAAHAGQRHALDTSSLAPPEPAPAVPLLLADDPEETPRTEPLPGVTVDRLAVVETTPGQIAAARITLRGACAGTMASLGPDGAPDLQSATTCIDEDGVRAPAPELAGGDPSSPSVVGSFAPEEACPAVVDAEAPVVCVPGGAFILGSRQAGGLDTFSATPERLVRVSRFAIDRHEVTVGRMRAALARGLELEDGKFLEYWPECAWSAEPAGREDFGMSCVSWYDARAFCQLEGGDLPTEAQWELVATQAGRDTPTRFPWGDVPPSCACPAGAADCHTAVFGRSTEALQMFDTCVAEDLPTERGPLPVNAAAGPNGDVTALGVVGLAGGLAEWVRDSFQPYDSACWRAAPMLDAACWENDAPFRSVRGGHWASTSGFTLGALRSAMPAGRVHQVVGFRCAYPDEAAR